MSSAPLIVSISGIRGLVGQSLTDEVVARFAAAFGTTLTPGATVVLARDTRPSGAAFAQAAAAALCQTGCRVVDVGKCSTPGAKLMVRRAQCQGRDHHHRQSQPGSLNGLKLVRADGVFLNAEEVPASRPSFTRASFAALRPARWKRAIQTPWWRTTSSRLWTMSMPMPFAGRVQGGRRSLQWHGGLGGSEPAGCLGRRSHLHQRAARRRFCPQPRACTRQPRPARPGRARQRLRHRLAIDPDADRVALVDSSGAPVGEDYTLALAVQAAAARQPGPVVTTLSTSQAVTDAATAHNCPVFSHGGRRGPRGGEDDGRARCHRR